MTGILEVAELAVRGAEITVVNVLGKLVDDTVVNAEMGALIAPRDVDVVCGVPIVRTGASTVVVGAADKLELVKGCRLLVEFKFAMVVVVVGKFEDKVYGVDEVVLVGVTDEEVATPGDPAGVGNETPGKVVMAALGGMSYF
jgi:hypothetical protein